MGRKCCKRTTFIHPSFFLCIVLLVVVVGAFAGCSYFFGFFEYLKPKDTPSYSATFLSESSASGESFPCIFAGCPLSGPNTGQTFYVQSGENGLRYTFTLTGKDLEDFGVAMAVDRLPLGTDSIEPHNSTLEYDFQGSCKKSNIFLTISKKPTSNHTGTFHLLLKGTPNEDTFTYYKIFQSCGFLNLWNFICLVIGIVGGATWLSLVLFWFGYSLSTKDFVPYETYGGENDLLLSSNPNRL
eukprot:TRINITY_DN15117_c0_g1_i1.p1 TRINITY_DN15117_c0_g1~~TRINITY_DN15117_c0_g1_i1.p1  ORF type:complete len:241 (+),score=33.53 TRINITY_DN15117_c0_g1_i1:46-768(+)